MTLHRHQDGVPGLHVRNLSGIACLQISEGESSRGELSISLATLMCCAVMRAPASKHPGQEVCNAWHCKAACHPMALDSTCCLLRNS